MGLWLHHLLDWVCLTPSAMWERWDLDQDWAGKHISEADIL